MPIVDIKNDTNITNINVGHSRINFFSKNSVIGRSRFIFSENKKPDIMKNISTALFPFPVQLANLPYSSISLNISYKY